MRRGNEQEFYRELNGKCTYKGVNNDVARKYISFNWIEDWGLAWYEGLQTSTERWESNTNLMLNLKIQQHRLAVLQYPKELNLTLLCEMCWNFKQESKNTNPKR